MLFHIQSILPWKFPRWIRFCMLNSLKSIAPSKYSR